MQMPSGISGEVGKDGNGCQVCKLAIFYADANWQVWVSGKVIL